jgi:hypothetical protein
MSENETKYLPFEKALKMVAAIQEEEDIDQKDKRILTVYNYDDEEICWFDYDEVMEAVGSPGKKAPKSAVQDYILHHIPDWSTNI